MLSGLLVLIAGVWAYHALARLWQEHLAGIAQRTLGDPPELGLRLEPPGYGAVVCARGVVGGQPVILTWRGGALGERSALYAGDRRWDLPLLDRRDALLAALRGAGLLPADQTSVES